MARLSLGMANAAPWFCALLAILSLEGIAGARVAPVNGTSIAKPAFYGYVGAPYPASTLRSCSFLVPQELAF